MKLIKRGLWSLIPLSIFLATPSCRDCDAYSNPSSYAVGAFYDKNDYSKVLTQDFEFVNGIDGPEITKMANGKYLLPLKVTSRETGFSFVMPGMADTTYISYFTSVEVNGPDCGAYEQITGLKVSPTEGGTGQDFYRGEFGALFDSVIVAWPTVSADTISENIRFIVDVCDAEEKSPSRNLIVTYFDIETGNPREELFSEIFIKGRENDDPIYDGSDRFSTIYLPLDGDETTTFVFRQKINGMNVDQEMKVVFNNTTTISDDETGCIFFNGTGDVLLESGGVTGKEFEFPDGPHFKKMQIDRTTVNTNPSFPNVKLFI
ncbi:hypothetical protein [Flammeovirga sp. SJP92]|uniref:hypothetical protein n=1 Tax=Flammeovirga sp. SJP92 TaxID=1775430 RepID=UPI0012FCCB2A|nr:hypothetical protein [Flammeovirga sp. SJP92]